MPDSFVPRTDHYSNKGSINLITIVLHNCRDFYSYLQSHKSLSEVHGNTDY